MIEIAVTIIASIFIPLAGLIFTRMNNIQQNLEKRLTQLERDIDELRKSIDELKKYIDMRLEKLEIKYTETRRDIEWILKMLNGGKPLHHE